jgi:outer membrane protein OmpA-like peptidoglycan-associated protein
MGGATGRRHASVGLSILSASLLVLPIVVSCATTAPQAPSASAHAIPLDEVGRRLAAIPDAHVEAQPTGLVVLTLPSDLVFADGRDLITGDGVERLRAVVERVAGYPDPLLRVKGHSDLDGSESYALKLSEDRAERVRAFLI